MEYFPPRSRFTPRNLSKIFDISRCSPENLRTSFSVSMKPTVLACTPLPLPGLMTGFKLFHHLRKFRTRSNKQRSIAVSLRLGANVLLPHTCVYDAETQTYSSVSATTSSYVSFKIATSRANADLLASPEATASDWTESALSYGTVAKQLCRSSQAPSF